MTDIKTWVVRLKREEAERKTLPPQHGASVPSHGEIIDVSINGALVRARVVHVNSPRAGLQGIFTIDADEILDR